MGVFKQLWEVYKEDGCELTLHRTISMHLGGGASSSMGATSDSGDALAIGAFITEMEVYLRDPDMFLLMLSVGLGGMFDTQSSFVGLLLREDVVQARIIDFLLEKLSDAASEMDANGAMEKNIPKLILREIRWIDHVVDSSELVEKLVSALPAFPVALQRDIIYILPEIASDEDACAVIDAMLELIRSEAELVVSCIEALGNFNVVNEQTSDVVKCVLERLDSSPLVDLPVIVKYLVQEAPGADVELIASELRDKLSATLSFSDTAGRRSSDASVIVVGGAAELAKSGNEEALVLGSIVQGFYFREDILKAFVTGISKCGESSSSGTMKLLDMWVIMAAHSIPRDRLKLEKLFKKKVATGIITRGLLVQSIKGHANALRSYFASLVQLASMLIMQQNNATCLAMGSLFYELLFEEFSLCQRDGKSEAAYYQGEIVTSLLGYCLSATGETTNAAFRTFLVLVSPQVSFQSEMRDRKYEQSHFKRRFRFQLFLPSLKQMLDAIEISTLDQVRHIYDILFSVGGPEDTELCNTLRKQCSHQESRYRLCGIIGFVSKTNRLLLQYREDATTRPDDAAAKEAEKAAATEFHRSLVDLFERTRSQGTCVAFMLEEVRRWVKNVVLDAYSTMLVTNILNYTMDIVSDRFMDDYNAPRARAGEYQKTVLGGALKADLWFSLDDQGSIVFLKLLELAASPNVREQESLHYMGALGELLLECARKTGDVRAVDCVLVCPIQIMEKSVIEDIAGLDDTIQNAVCSAVWHSINWIRSIIGFYAHEKMAYHKEKVVQRLQNLVYLESLLLDELVESCPQFGPPGMQFTDPAAQKSLGVTKKKAGRPPKNAQSLDRAALVRQSFSPVRADVLKILASPTLWKSVTEPSSVQAQPTNSSDSVRPEVLVECLMTMFEEFVGKAQAMCAKNAEMSPFLLVFSDAFKWTHASTPTQTSTDWSEATQVMQYACKYADHFMRVLQKAANEDEEDDDTTGGDAEDGIVLQRIAKRVVLAYLNIATILFGGVKAIERDTKMLPAQVCQQYFLPAEQHVVLQATADKTVKDQVLETCFVAATKFSSVVMDDIQLTTTLLQTLVAISSVAHGFPASQAACRATSIELKAVQDESAATAMNAKISTMALTFLQHDWSCGDKKHVYKSTDLDVFLGCYLNHSKLILDSIQTLALDGFLALLENGGADVADYPTLNKKTLPSFHRAMFDALVSATVRLDFDNDKLMTKRAVVLLLNYLTQAVLLFKLLVAITKSVQKSKVVANVLKIGRKFVELIVRAMPFLQRHFVDHNAVVMKIIADVQFATRRMQVLCAHGKLIKDATAAAQVPMVKRLLERFIDRGEQLARSHGMLDAFTTGVLKNKRIDGTTISKAELNAMEGAGSDSSESENHSDAEPDARDNGSSTEDEETKQGEEDEDQEEEGSQEEASTRPQKKKKRS